MKFDATVTLGTVLQAATFAIGIVVAYHKATTWLGEQLYEFKTTLSTHAKQLEQHADRMDRYEQRYVEIAGDLQYLVGRTGGERKRGER